MPRRSTSTATPDPTGRASTSGPTRSAGASPVAAFPTTPLIDQFGRANGALGSAWGGDVSGTTPYRIQGNAVQVRGSGQAWSKAGGTSGADQEAYLTIGSLSSAASQQGLLLKLRAPGTIAASYVKVALTSSGNVRIWTRSLLQGEVIRGNVAASAAFVAGDRLGARALSDGSVTVYRNGIAIGSVNVTSGTNAWPSALARAGGRIGVSFTGASSSNPATFDDFGGGTRP